MRARQSLEHSPVVLDRSREHAHQHDSIFLEPDNLSDRCFGLLVTDDDIPTWSEVEVGSGVADVAVRKPVSVAAVIVEPEIPRRHIKSLLSPGRVRDRQIEANLQPIERGVVKIREHDVVVRSIEGGDEREAKRSKPTDR